MTASGEKTVWMKGDFAGQGVADETQRFELLAEGPRRDLERFHGRQVGGRLEDVVDVDGAAVRARRRAGSGCPTPRRSRWRAG